MADFNFVVCGIATIAATVGYACVRKLRPLPLRAQQVLPPTSDSTPQTPLIPEKFAVTSSDWDSETTEKGSLKRKRAYDPEDDADHDVGYPENLKSIYPRKRRSGSVSDQEEQHERTTDVGEGHLDVTSDTPQINTLAQTEEQIEEPPADLPLVTSSVEEQPEEAPPDPVPASPQPESQPDPPSSPIPPTFPQVPRFVFPQPPPNIFATRFPSTRSQPFVGFANFASAGTSSPFLSSDSAPVSGKSIWADSADAGTSISTLDADAEGNGSADPLPALAPLKTPVPTTVQTPITGEEDESPVLELKGVKLFVKRGEENFSTGMLGHVKLLEHKTSKARRLLFRREPLWKVSMNARLGPTNPMRCTFDERECVLRVALKELELDSSVTVIYAFKPGRACKKSDFQEFSESLLALTRASGQQ